MKTILKKHPYLLPVTSIGAVMLLFWLIVPIYPNTSTSSDRLLLYMADAWRKDFLHGWAVPFLFVFFVVKAWPQMKLEPVKGSVWGLLGVVFTILLFVVSVRTLQPRLPIIGLPFLIVGGVMFVYGWKVARHMLFPAFFWYFAISVPGLQQATNMLQISVTQSCYHVGTFFGMDLVNSGTTIRPASGSWDDLDIAEGCSGIRSLMALVMISAIYAYFTQKKVWKMAALFACALPLALIANFFRIFTILVLANMGYSKFAAGAYHDWAGLLFFFPIALTGLFVLDKLLNWKGNRKVVRTRRQ
ncbi:MAG: exosortase/archaeosortase family protein [Verrucomicrobiae bacterium]|nr:exosortase/archaeosortase family protein [Verrucomicrobiae bacterium]NNJ42536.1 exosortase/archaeosortase family protein [Akkermansiaceae bacterium]